MSRTLSLDVGRELRLGQLHGSAKYSHAAMSGDAEGRSDFMITPLAASKMRLRKFVAPGMMPDVAVTNCIQCRVAEAADVIPPGSAQYLMAT